MGRGTERNLDEAERWYRKACSLGNNEAAFQLGKLCEYYRKDSAEAVKWLRKAADWGHAGAMCRLAGYYYLGKGGLEQDEIKAMQFLRAAADAGDAEAMCELGRRFALGNGVARNMEKAGEWYRRAEDADSLTALVRLGEACLENIWIGKTTKDAAQYFERALELGDERGAGGLGFCYLMGEGVPKDEVKGVELLRRGVKVEYNWAMCWLANYYFLKGDKTKYKEAGELLRKAAENGNSEAMAMLGSYYAAEGEEQNLDEAERWLTRAVELGNARGTLTLGLFYWNEGKCDQETAEKAMRLMRDAVDMGAILATISLGACYEAGVGGKPDYDEAERWYRKGLEVGLAESAFRLGFLLVGQGAKGAKDERKVQEGLAMLQKAAEWGDPRGWIALGYYWANGIGGKKDLRKAKEFYRKAEASGVPEAEEKARAALKALAEK
ncbi:MAG: sel1 repeat family protein [Thermoguttaceae bacterium]|nr:sel1 repeat family protein [Thermoguttaceae bacterium]